MYFVFTAYGLDGRVFNVVDFWPQDLHHWCQFEPSNPLQVVRFLDAYPLPGVSPVYFLTPFSHNIAEKLA